MKEHFEQEGLGSFLMAHQPLPYLPTLPLGQDIAQGQFLSGV